MSKYTTEVRYICEASINEANLEELSVDEIITRAMPHVFNFDFPIYDEEYRTTLCRKILKHYYTREIGVETVGLWKLRLNTKLNEIMPYYNQLYTSARLEFDPLLNSKITREHTLDRTDNNTDTLESNGESVGRREELVNNTPQGAITRMELDEGAYLSSAKITNDNNTNMLNSTETSNRVGKDIFKETVEGFNGVAASKLLMDYRKTFLNIDMMIIKELDCLFMQVW